GDERLNRECRRLRVRVTTGGEREAAVAVLEAAQEGKRACNRLAAHTRCAERLDRGSGVVRVRRAAARPREAAVRLLRGEHVTNEGSRRGLARLAVREYRPDRLVD